MSAQVMCISACRQCAGLFRLGRDVEAALIMVDVFDEAQQFFSLAREDVQRSWAQVLTHILACQERQDWLGLADFIEYELIELLDGAQG